jgi:hypothetical protein
MSDHDQLKRLFAINPWKVVLEISNIKRFPTTLKASTNPPNWAKREIKSSVLRVVMLVLSDILKITPTNLYF